MNKHKFTIEVEAESKEQAVEKLEAFTKINGSLNHGQFVDMANYMAEHPKDVESIVKILGNPKHPIHIMAKKFL